MADLSLLVNLASVEFVSSTNQSLLGFNRSGGSPVWAPQNVGSLAFPKHLGSFWEYPYHFVCIPPEFHSQSSFSTKCVLVLCTMYLDFSCGVYLYLIEHMVDVV